MSGTLPPKIDLFGVGVTPCSYGQAVSAVIDAARERKAFTLTALATHGLMLAHRDPEFAALVGGIDLVAPDGQPVRWALNVLHGAGLADRVYGPDLTRLVCGRALNEGISVFLFGSTAQTCDAMVASLHNSWPGLTIAGVQPDRFREATPEEDAADVIRINESGAGIVLVGRGCPRQERWVATHANRVPAALLAVGAAFDFIAGTQREPPRWMQDAGLEWLHRLAHEPGRLWRRYLVTNSLFIAAFTREYVKMVSSRSRRSLRRSSS